jgi:hypothetical protein
MPILRGALRYLLELAAVVLVAIAVVDLLDRLVVWVLPVHDSQWLFLGCALALLIVLRIVASRPSPLTAPLGPWWRSHIMWEAENWLVAAVCDATLIFVFVAIFSWLATSSRHPLVDAVSCAGIIFAFSATVGYMGTRRANRQRSPRLG